MEVLEFLEGDIFTYRRTWRSRETRKSLKSEEERNEAETTRLKRKIHKTLINYTLTRSPTGPRGPIGPRDP